MSWYFKNKCSIYICVFSHIILKFNWHHSQKLIFLNCVFIYSADVLNIESLISIYFIHKVITSLKWMFVIIFHSHFFFSFLENANVGTSKVKAWTCVEASQRKIFIQSCCIPQRVYFLLHPLSSLSFPFRCNFVQPL